MSGATKKQVKKALYTLERAWFKHVNGSLHRPDFINIGSGQAGSTWMFKNFQQHPNVFVCDKKETHYFSYAFDEWSFSYYCSLFAPAGERVCGELTPAYLLLTPERIQQIQQLIPDVRLIMTIRNPVDRGWSGARRTLSKVAAQQGISLDELPDSEYFEYFDKEWAYKPERNPIGEFVPGMLQGHYSAAIDNWLQHFSDEQLQVIFFDDIKQRPKELMMDVCRHIGAPVDIDWQQMPLSKVVNKNPSKVMPPRFREYLKELYRDEIAELHHRFGERVANWH